MSDNNTDYIKLEKQGDENKWTVEVPKTNINFCSRSMSIENNIKWEK